MSTALEICGNFKQNVLKLIDYLIDITESDSDLIAARLGVRMIPDTKAIENFAKHSQGHREQIEHKEELYFLNNEDNPIFSEFKASKVNKFKDLWKSLRTEQKDCIWKYFSYFLRLSDRYCQLTGKQY